MTMARIRNQLNQPYTTREIRENRRKRDNRAMAAKGKVKVLSIPGQKAKALKAERLSAANLLRDFVQLVKTNQLGMDPWAHLPGETDLSFERFQSYLMQTRLPGQVRRRTLDRVAKQYGINGQTVGNIAQKWHWVLRAAAWDAEMERVAHEEFVSEKRAIVRKQARLGGKLQELALLGAENMITQRGLDLTAQDVARLADTGVKIERLAHGDATSHEARQTETRIVWDGPTPKWANKSEEVAPIQQQLGAGDTEERADREMIRAKVQADSEGEGE